MSPQKETEKNMSDIFEEADELEFEIVTMTDEDGTDCLLYTSPSPRD